MNKRFIKISSISLAVAIHCLMIFGVWFILAHITIPQEKSKNPTDVYNTIMADPRFSNMKLNLFYIYYTIKEGKPVFQGLKLHFEMPEDRGAYWVKYAKGDKQASVESTGPFPMFDPINLEEPDFSQLTGKIEDQMHVSLKDDEGMCLMTGAYKAWTVEKAYEFWHITLYRDFLHSSYNNYYNNLKEQDIYLD